ncbi:MAG: hypothetical protein JWR18_324 [Segetibacter sp.]|jgi:hypothetical protein|nr:hypothetical protein [Segetibacter sp.]
MHKERIDERNATQQCSSRITNVGTKNINYSCEERCFSALDDNRYLLAFSMSKNLLAVVSPCNVASINNTEPFATSFPKAQRCR